MKEYFDFDMQIPSSDALLIHELKKWLFLAGTRTKVVVVLDALNQLDDGSGDAGIVDRVEEKFLICKLYCVKTCL